MLYLGLLNFFITMRADCALMRYVKSLPFCLRERSQKIYHITFRVFCPSAGSSLQAQEPRLQFYRRQVFHRKLRRQGSSFTRN